MWRFDLTDEQAKQIQQLIHCGLKHVAATDGLPALIEATKAAESILAVVVKVEVEEPCQQT
jgi:hypothetical protein